MGRQVRRGGLLLKEMAEAKDFSKKLSWRMPDWRWE